MGMFAIILGLISILILYFSDNVQTTTKYKVLLIEIIFILTFYIFAPNEKFEDIREINYINVKIENKFEYCLYKKWEQKKFDTVPFNEIYIILPISECKTKFNELMKK